MADESETVYVIEECVDSPFESSSDSDDDVILRDEEEEQEGDAIVEAAGSMLGAEPYQFEPKLQRPARPPESAQHETEVVDDQRMTGTLWCSCSGGCQVMQSQRETICCKELEQVVSKMDEYATEDASRHPLDCITAHPGFQTVCLDRWVLETAYYQYRQQYGHRKDATDHQRMRHVAYRQLARWCWGYLGKEVRVPLPSCAVTKIRTTFPSDDFSGFHDVPLE